MAGLDWASMQNSIAGGGCAYSEVLRAIVNVLVDKGLMTVTEVGAAVDAAVKESSPVDPIVVEKGA